MDPKHMVFLLVGLYTITAGLYAMKGQYGNTMYWLSAASISISTLLMTK